ncbi:hypothetical protein M514_00248 [Trichuris suis]|uniref:Uncharacterized protein n=1 Tax=Trichuris suis TaxID=68888 RepID=A0A085MPD9_9BILA|nr:hypothetical protein M513_00248 [Trichuris suis]KFD67846.1 hypothetical protein M514_00248 [Trichuris suis]
MSAAVNGGVNVERFEMKYSVKNPMYAFVSAWKTVTKDGCRCLTIICRLQLFAATMMNNVVTLWEEYLTSLHMQKSAFVVCQ